MKTSDFVYDLPEELIAQHPLDKRDNSRLMKIDRESGKLEHMHFYELPSLLKKGDCLILNDTRVLPARLYGIKRETGAHVEFLLLKQIETNLWEAAAGPGKRAGVGTSFDFGDGSLSCTVEQVKPDGNRIIRFSYTGESFYSALYEIGQMPLPHYITEELKDKERYQTVYSRELGSAAAPTAGLHFTKELLEQLKEQGVNIGYVTLHVGLGTFRPVKAVNIEEHKMHSEHYYITEETAQLINKTKAEGGRVISVGTTSCRTLESVAAKFGDIRADEGDTEIFMYPGFKFRCIDGLITNFHLPGSTLIMLVSAFLGYDKTMSAYRTAVDERYRFFSFGDACLIL